MVSRFINKTRVRLLSFIIATLFVTPIILDSPQAHGETEFEKFKRQQNQEFSQFQTEYDRAFISYLDKHWEAFDVFQGKVRDTTPKIQTPPAVRNNRSTQLQPTEQSKLAIKRTYRMVNQGSGFFGHSIDTISFPVGPQQFPELSTVTNKKLKSVWQQLSETDHESTLEQLKRTQAELDLGDWGTIKLVEHLLERQFSDRNQRRAYAWFILNRLQYEIRTGYTSNEVVLLMPVEHQVFGRDYISIDKKPYYILNKQAKGKVYTYDDVASSPDQQALNFSFNKLIKTSAQITELAFDYPIKSKNQNFKIVFDSGLSDFLKDYPQIALKWYFATEPQLPTDASLTTQLEPLVRDLPERQAVDLLLQITQNMFDYQTDTEQFEQEKYLLIDESLYYGTNDCEDRSIFLAWMLRKILNIETIALDYPGHVALAVRTRVRPGDHLITHQGKKYVIADPTYINAALGNVMPKLKNTLPEVIPVVY